jgi:hypothetical protein
MANPFYDRMPTGELLSKLLVLGIDVQSMSNIISAVAQNFQMYLWLTAPLTVYVSPSGVDTTANSQGLSVDNPFKTLQYALNFVSSKYNFNQYNVTIQLADGSYNLTGNTVVPAYVATTGQLWIVGNSTDNTKVKTGRLTNTSRGTCILKDLTLAPGYIESGSYHGLVTGLQGSQTSVFNCRMIMPSNVTSQGVFGICTWTGGTVSLTGTTKFEFVVDDTSIITAFLYASTNSLHNVMQDVQVTGSSQMATFVTVETVGTINAWINPEVLSRAPKFTTTGTLTGKRYTTEGNGVIKAVIGTATDTTIFPGTIPGESTFGGQYIAIA